MKIHDNQALKITEIEEYKLICFFNDLVRLLFQWPLEGLDTILSS